AVVDAEALHDAGAGDFDARARCRRRDVTDRSDLLDDAREHQCGAISPSSATSWPSRRTRSFARSTVLPIPSSALGPSPPAIGAAMSMRRSASPEATIAPAIFGPASESTVLTPRSAS